MKLLLHTCCAPCLIYPLERLKNEKIEVGGFFYNPNIHPISEYQNRRKAIVDFSSRDSIKILYPEYLPAEFLYAVNSNKDKPQRCSICWSLRLKKTAQTAKKNGFDSFSTTLLVSPYQDQELLKKIGSDISKEEGIDFYYEDFRVGFKEAHNLAKKQGIYCQNYCGCMYSQEERCKKSEKH